MRQHSTDFSSGFHNRTKIWIVRDNVLKNNTQSFFICVSLLLIVNSYANSFTHEEDSLASGSCYVLICRTIKSPWVFTGKGLWNTDHLGFELGNQWEIQELPRLWQISAVTATKAKVMSLKKRTPGTRLHHRGKSQLWLTGWAHENTAPGVFCRFHVQIGVGARELPLLQGKDSTLLPERWTLQKQEPGLHSVFLCQNST